MRALITGIAGQDGSYLAEQLLADGVEVHGLVRPPLERPLANIEHVRDRLELHTGDLLEAGVAASTLAATQPDRVFHLAAPTFVPASWRDPRATIEAIAGTTAELLHAAATSVHSPRVLVAGSREIFGDAPHTPQDERTPCQPTTPYGIAKLASHQLVGVLRSHDDLFACSAILFNHESPRRPEQFVTRRVTRAAAAISLGLQDELTIGDLDAVRDWSAASDMMRGCRAMLEAPAPGDYVLASGIGRSVRELVGAAFAAAGVPVDGYVRVDESFLRPRERVAPVGNPAKAQERLGWRAETSFEDLIAAMVERDLELLSATAARDRGAPSA